MTIPSCFLNVHHPEANDFPFGINEVFLILNLKYIVNYL